MKVQFPKAWRWKTPDERGYRSVEFDRRKQTLVWVEWNHDEGQVSRQVQPRLDYETDGQPSGFEDLPKGVQKALVQEFSQPSE